MNIYLWTKKKKKRNGYKYKHKKKIILHKKIFNKQKPFFLFLFGTKYIYKPNDNKSIST